MTTLAEPGPEQAPRPKSLYGRDIYSWTRQQSQALQRRDLKAIDWENVIDEIASLGRGLQYAWKDYCARVIELFLKIEHWDDSSSARDPQHWAAAAQGCRLEMEALVDENPGLESRYAAMFAEAWEGGRKNAVRKLAGYDVISTPHAAYASAENKWDGVLPRKCPYRFADVTGFACRRNGEPREDIWPPSVARALNCDFRVAYPVRRARAKRQARRQPQTPRTQPAPASSNPRQDSLTGKLYDRDCCAWAAQQTEALQRRDALFAFDSIAVYVNRAADRGAATPRRRRHRLGKRQRGDRLAGQSGKRSMERSLRPRRRAPAGHRALPSRRRENIAVLDACGAGLPP